MVELFREDDSIQDMINFISINGVIGIHGERIAVGETMYEVIE